MILTKIQTTTLICALVLSVGGLALATPVIKDFSSKGGRTTNKAGPKDRMYLVKPGDKITFTVKADGAEKYEWQVNKKVQAKVRGELFTWTVPNKKGIWEIHLVVAAGEKQVHQEWVVSTISKQESPDFFDYFTDMKIQKRDRTDPWGRPLPEWKGVARRGLLPGAGRCFMRSREPTKKLTREYTSADSTAAYGTWRLRYRFPTGNKGVKGKVYGHFYFYYICVGSGNNSIFHNYREWHDTHHHCIIRRPGIKGFLDFSMEYDGAGVSKDKDWYEVTIVRTRDGWVRIYWEGILEMFMWEEVPTKCERIGIEMRRSADPKFSNRSIDIDCLEIYKDKYLFPAKSIEYRSYVTNMKPKENRRHYAVRGKGIVLNGRGIRLRDIAATIDEKYFKKTGENTYTCYTNLIVDDGAEFVIKGETLKFHCTKDGELEFGQNFGSLLRIEDSTVTSDSEHYFVWNNCAPDTHFAHKKIINSRSSRSGSKDTVFRINTHDISGYCCFVAKNSLIKNTAKMYFDSPYVLDISNTRFENIRAIDRGIYPKSRSPLTVYRNAIKGKKSFYVTIDDLNLHDFTMRGVTFTGSEPLDITFMINALRDRLNIYDVDAGAGRIVLKDVPIPNETQSHSWLPYTHQRGRSWGAGWIDGKLGLVNCKFKEIVISTTAGKNCNAYALPKYYLDVKVVNPDGSPVAGAKVRVNCDKEIGTLVSTQNRKYTSYNPHSSIPRGCDLKTVWADPEYSPENMEVSRPASEGKFKNIYNHYRFVAGQKKDSTTTSKNGHTPLPVDAKNTMILTDYVQDKSGKKEFAYTITIEKDGKKKVITGVNPGPEWYRPDPNKPTYTITAVLDDKTITEVELKKKGLAGPVKKQGKE